MSTPIYRVAGYPSARSLAYLQALGAAGWPASHIEQLKIDLPRFESASVRYDVETSLKACIYPIDAAHYPFLIDLNEHIQITSRAEISEELRRKAMSNDKDSIAAGAILAGMNEQEISAITGGNTTNIRVSQLKDMSTSDLDREIKETEKRLGISK